MKQSEWGGDISESQVSSELPLGHISTRDVLDFPQLQSIGSGLIESIIKGPDDMVKEMKSWLRTGVSPDGTRMVADGTIGWSQDFYHGTKVNDTEHESLPEDGNVDYYYWTCPYKSQIGDIQMVMMQSQVNFADGTHMPADRLQKKFRKSKKLNLYAEKYLHVLEREKQQFYKEKNAIHDRDHPLRKKGIYTKVFYNQNCCGAPPEANFDGNPIQLEGTEY